MSLPHLNAQQPLASTVALDRELIRAEALLQSFKNDSAILLTGSLLKKLERLGQFDSPFGIRVQLAEANAYEQDQRSELALQKTLRIQQKSQQKRLWEVHARSCLVLALIYEKIQLKERSREQLDLAEITIKQHRLGTIYPYFAIRRSSWEYIYHDQRTALFFAKEALRTAPHYGLLLEEAISHMLLNTLLPKSTDSERLHHCLAGIRLYQKLGDHTGSCIMFSSASQIYQDRSEFRRALTYNDSAIVQANLATAEGNKHDLRPAVSYRQRGRIYEQMGRLDSALANVRKGYQLELAFNQEEIQDKIIEVELRYQTKLKQKQINDQQLALQLKDSQLRFFVIIVVLVLVSAIGLFLAYRKQRRDKQTLAQQNRLILHQAEQLRSLDAAKSRFFANVSHELRTPLTLLLGPISTLLTENHLTHKQAHLLLLAHRSGKQLEQLVTDILDLGKLELGKMDLDQKPTPVAAFFRSHLAQFESLAISRHIYYAFDVAVVDDAVANLDQAKCRQILNNLLANAFKFTPSGGRITATLTLTNGKLHLIVTDTGSGIHPDDLPHLFDRYFQTTRPDKPAEGGTGIGLALCQEYVRLMGGTIDVESTLGIGSVFRVMWPVSIRSGEVGALDQGGPVSVPFITGDEMASSVRAVVDEPAVSPATARPLPPHRRTGRPTILVVEDNPDLQAYIRLILGDNYTIVTAENGRVALERLRREGQEQISLILSDIMMPVMDGHQLLEALKADDATRHIPVIMLTARADMQDKLRALRIGVDDYLLKPFEEAELLARIDNLLANQVARRQTVAQDEPPPELLHQPIGDAQFPQDGGPAGTYQPPLLSQADRDWLEIFEKYVQQHMADPMLTVPDMTEEFAMSESTLLRQLKRLTGLSPIQYVQAVRLEEARRLLENRTSNSIAQVAIKIGYTDARLFSRHFQSRFGKLPSKLLET